MRVGLVLMVIAAGISTAVAQSLFEISSFADNICKDIPEGQLTRTEIAGKVQANIGALAVIVGGSGAVDAVRKEEFIRASHLTDFQARYRHLQCAKAN